MAEETKTFILGGDNANSIPAWAEFTHAAMHITEALGQDPYSESPCYLAGELMGFAADSILRLV